MMSDVPPQPTFLSASGALVVAHVGLLHGIINRLATSSASCKTWCLTLVTSVVSLAGATRTPAIVTAALVPVLIFGFLDTMYLSQERAYRDIYANIVRKIHDGTYALADTFNAEASPSLSIRFKTLASWAIWPVYGGLLAVYVTARCAGWLALLAKPAGS
jgi:hypothetical protein